MDLMGLNHVRRRVEGINLCLQCIPYLPSCLDILVIHAAEILLLSLEFVFRVDVVGRKLGAFEVGGTSR
jgi:hypothetical protein